MGNLCIFSLSLLLRPLELVYQIGGESQVMLVVPMMVHLTRNELTYRNNSMGDHMVTIGTKKSRRLARMPVLFRESGKGIDK